MISFSGSLKIFLSVEPVDMRAGFERLANLVDAVLKENLREGALFVFTNRRHTRIKVLCFDGSGLWLMCKRHAPQCPFRFVFQTAISLSPVVRH